MPDFLDKETVKRYGLKGDPNFSAKRNRQVIAETIAETDANYKRRLKEIEEGIAERSELVTYYIKHLIDHKSDQTIESYAGKETLHRLWGKARIEDLQRRAKKAGFNIKLLN